MKRAWTVTRQPTPPTAAHGRGGVLMLQPVPGGSIRPDAGTDAFGDGWSYRLLMVNCGRCNCRPCRKGPSHGPYWYAERKKPGDYSAYPKTQTRYIGKRLRPVADVEASRRSRRRE